MARLEKLANRWCASNAKLATALNASEDDWMPSLNPLAKLLGRGFPFKVILESWVEHKSVTWDSFCSEGIY